ncbi:DUF3219 family protein [Ornithinibacillus californiensis]|uniref:DUF3219 family protein n=1 Tax=Ornithinibacillus californiensis TaxID=161536 RepID=UPI00069F8FAD|nr:DUF3219 family protein [Ornithinibacillus californiensis]
MSTIWINELAIEAENYSLTTVQENGATLHRLELEFQVTHDTYHDVTVDLYKNDFLVKIPGEAIEFQAKINNYSTSLTNLYEKDAVGDFKVILIEKSDS